MVVRRAGGRAPEFTVDSVVEALVVLRASDLYYRAAGDDIVCPRHGGFDTCCDRQDEHIPVLRLPDCSRVSGGCRAVNSPVVSPTTQSGPRSDQRLRELALCPVIDPGDFVGGIIALGHAPPAIISRVGRHPPDG
ncbi:hypothetical protein ACG83_04825 [Frankia sp. R43]|nr:hypothetical protein ACG83_04825 [Frankia sp. R43]